MLALGSDSALIPGATTSGVRALFVAPFAVGRYTYAGADRAELTSLGPLSGWLVAVRPGPAAGAGPAAAAGEESQPALTGWRFAQAITLAGPGLCAGRRAVAEALRAAGAVVALWQDAAGQWWCYGQERGLRLSGRKAGSSPAADVLTLTGTEPAPARAVRAALAEATLYPDESAFSRGFSLGFLAP